MKKMFFMGLLMGALLFAQNVWINEFHYDNVSTDEGEFIEIVLQNSENFNLNDFTVTFYNGSNGSEYDAKTLDEFTVGQTVADYTIFYYFKEGIQNGAPDGFALSYQGGLIPGQFISYEGELEATEGVANGATSTDIGVAESSTTEIGMSLQLSGLGAQYSDFVWVEPAAETIGQLNNNQTLDGNPNPTITVISPNGGEEWEQNSIHEILWSSVNFEGNVDIYLYEAWGRNREILLVANVENDGIWEWEIPADLTAHPNYTIGICGVIDGDPCDISDADFSIIEPILPEELTIFDIQYTQNETGDSDYIDQYVQTSGVVTAEFENTFFIQDGVGEWNGVCIYPAEFDVTEIEVGQNITITGYIAEYNGKTEIMDLTNIVINGTENLPDPSPIFTGYISIENYNPEAWEGVLVQTSEVAVTNPDLGYGTWEIDDGIDSSGPCVVGHSASYEYVPVLNDILPRVVGIVDFAYGSFRIEPRDDNDFLSASAENFELEIVNYKLQNYPNPFNVGTTISFDIVDVNSPTTIEIFNLKGQKVKQYSIQSNQSSIVWDADKFSSGIYFCKLIVDGKIADSRKMILMK